MISLDAFGAWALGQGQVGNPNGTYVGQCVSLVQQYLDKCYDIPYAPRGNARAFVPPQFHRVTGGWQPGDIIRYGSNYGGGYGHIGIIDVNGKFLDQNGTKALHVAFRDRPFSGINAIYRPDHPCKMHDDAPATAGLVTQRGTYECTANMVIRYAPAVDDWNKSGKTWNKGERFSYDSYIDANGYRWVSYVGRNSRRRCYVARRNWATGEVYGKCY